MAPPPDLLEPSVEWQLEHRAFQRFSPAMGRPSGVSTILSHGLSAYTSAVTTCIFDYMKSLADQDK